VAFVGLASPDAALSLFSLAMDRAGAALTAFELIAKRPYDFTLAHAQGVVRPLADDWPWYVLMQISSGRSSEDARTLIEDVLSAGLEQEFVGDAVIAASLGQGDGFWNFRELLPDAQKPEGASIKHDISVPVALIPRFIEEAASVVDSVSAGARVVCFGHMGDGNLHYNISRPVDGDDEAFLDLYHAMNNAVHDVVRRLDGSISAEHGIGQLKRDELIATAPPMAIDLMRRVKAAFDPAGIMNPGKVI
jgi:FAD/FMN-containing dehydrogenase